VGTRGLLPLLYAFLNDAPSGRWARLWLFMLEIKINKKSKKTSVRMILALDFGALAIFASIGSHWY